MVKNARRPNGQAVFHVQIQRIVGYRLTDSHCMLFVAQVHHINARHFIQSLVERGSFGVFNLGCVKLRNGDRSFPPLLLFPAGSYNNRLQINR